MSDRLAQHPEVFSNPIKELHWFDPEPARAYYDGKFIKRAARALKRADPRTHLDAKRLVLLRRVAMRSDGHYITISGT